MIAVGTVGAGPELGAGIVDAVSKAMSETYGGYGGLGRPLRAKRRCARTARRRTRRAATVDGESGCASLFRKCSEKKSEKTTTFQIYFLLFPFFRLGN